MNIVLITAAGVGSRTQQYIPKQFLSINDKPILVYTLEKFQKCSKIDKIAVVCLKGWENYLIACAKQFGISKLEFIFEGGETGLDSIKNGVFGLKEVMSEDDILIIHDGNRPGVSFEIIEECIETTKTHGISITKIPCTEVVFDITNSSTSPATLNRDFLLRTQTPHAIRYMDALELYTRADQEKLSNVVALCSLASYYNKPLFFNNGSEINFKITTKEDIDLFKGILLVEGAKHV